MMVRVRGLGLPASLLLWLAKPKSLQQGQEVAWGGQVSTGCLCTPSQLQAQVATLTREVTQLQRQRERSLEKESSRVKVLSSNPQPPKGHFPPPDLTQGPRVQACVPAVEWAMASRAPALTALRVLRPSTLPLRPTARDRLRAGLRRLS